MSSVCGAALVVCAVSIFNRVAVACEGGTGLCSNHSMHDGVQPAPVCEGGHAPHLIPQMQNKQGDPEGENADWPLAQDEPAWWLAYTTVTSGEVMWSKRPVERPPSPQSPASKSNFTSHQLDVAPWARVSASLQTCLVSDDSPQLRATEQCD